MNKPFLAHSFATLLAFTLVSSAGASHADSDLNGRLDSHLDSPLDSYPNIQTDNNQHSPESIKKSASPMIGSIIGTVVGGPVGLLVGAFGGIFLGDELSKADQYDVLVDENQQVHGQLADAQHQLSSLQQRLHAQNEEQKALHALAMSHLEFQILFHTGNDALALNELERLDDLAEFLQKNSHLSIRLHGHADPRGSSRYNTALSSQRSSNVRYALEARGIESARIEHYFYGSEQSQALTGDLDAYVFDRRVTIEVFDHTDDVATID